MQGIHSLHDLKNKLSQKGIEIKNSEGWCVDTDHGRWTMSFDNVYLNKTLIKNLDSIEQIKKLKIKKIQVNRHVN